MTIDELRAKAFRYVMEQDESGFTHRSRKVVYLTDAEAALAECERETAALKWRLAAALDPTWPTEAGQGEIETNG